MKTSEEATVTRYDRWVRVPTEGREPTSGLHRSFIYELISARKIKTASIKKPGALKGVRLIWLPSLMAFIERHVEDGSATK